MKMIFKYIAPAAAVEVELSFTRGVNKDNQERISYRKHLSIVKQNNG
jgi:hypothetical protein